MSPGYRYALDDSCCDVFSLLPRRQRERLLDFFRRLAKSPFASGDYRESDSRGVSLEVALIDDEFLVTWHADHAVKEVRVVGLEVV
jgi:hypothetical protein